MYNIKFQVYNIVPFMDHCCVVAKGLVQLSEIMSHATQGHPRRTGHSGEFLKNMVRWSREWQTIPVYLLREPHELYTKVKRYDTERWALSQVRRYHYATGAEWRAITNSSRKKEAAKVEMTLSSGCVWWRKENPML